MSHPSLVPAYGLLPRFWTVVLITSAKVDTLELEWRTAISWVVPTMRAFTDPEKFPAWR